MKHILIISFLIISCHCKAQTTAEEYETFFDEFVQNEYLVNIYSEYDDGAFAFGLLPDIGSMIKVSDKKYIFDVNELENRLRATGLFNNSFIAREINQCNACNDAMMLRDWDYYPDPDFNIEECNYIWEDRVSGATGEPIHGYVLENNVLWENGAWSSDVVWDAAAVYRTRVVLVTQNGSIKIHRLTVK